jgi:putative membrane protein
MKDKEEASEFESKYIQQHLANERTFLAWIRTAGAIMGIGFLATSYHFKTSAGKNGFTDQIAFFIGGYSILLGVLAIVFAQFSYLKKRRGINTQTFHSSHKSIITVALFMLVLTALYFIYLVAVY